MRVKGYVLSTALLTLALYLDAIVDLAQPPALVESLRRLGYPDHVTTILGVWKSLAVIAIVAPGFPRLKEWAYAGVFFAYSGAILSQISAEAPAGALVPGVLLVLAMTSWALRPEGRVLPDLPEPERLP